ncbi:MAG TPA: FAD-dependent oxidoreductase [Acidimicrobiales bacterium]|nr:FAD-dependent oxidoreductase [Acidimicrobiales bacterium]
MTAPAGKDSFDLVVIGAGPAGEKGAAQAAYHGKRVAIVERSAVPGGTAVATGGIPTKALRETALYLRALQNNEADGLTVDLDSEAVFERLRIRAGSISAVMSEAVSKNLANHGIELIHGRARLGPDRRVIVESDGRPPRELAADVVLLAPGSRPVRPDSIAFDGHAVLDSDPDIAASGPGASRSAVMLVSPLGTAMIRREQKRGRVSSAIRAASCVSGGAKSLPAGVLPRLRVR